MSQPSIQAETHDYLYENIEKYCRDYLLAHNSKGCLCSYLHEILNAKRPKDDIFDCFYEEVLDNIDNY